MGGRGEPKRQRAESQRIVATRPLSRLQYPVTYLSLLQRVAEFSSSSRDSGHASSQAPFGSPVLANYSPPRKDGFKRIELALSDMAERLRMPIVRTPRQTPTSTFPYIRTVLCPKGIQQGSPVLCPKGIQQDSSAPSERIHYFQPKL